MVKWKGGSMAKRRRRRRRIHLGRLFFVFLSVSGFFALLFLGVGQVRQLLETAPPIQDMFHDITSSAYPRDHSQEVAAIKKGNALDKVVTAGFTDEEVRSLFYTSDLSDSIVAKITGSTFFSGQDFISIEDLRYVRVLYIDFNGDTRIGELIVNEEIASDMEDIFYDLYLHQYQIGKMALADTYSGSETQNMEANNTFALLFSQPYAMEQNAFNSGYAIHLNPLYNPKVSESYGRTIVTPASSYSYANRLNEKSHMINKEDYAYEAFTKRGYKWAGTDKETQNYGVFWKTYPKKETEEDTDQEEQDTTPTYDPYGWYT